MLASVEGLSTSLVAAERAALRSIQRRALDVASSVRFGLVGVFLPLAWLLSRRGHADWSTYLAPLALYALPAAALLALRKHPWLPVFAPPAWVLDVGLIFFLQRSTMPLSPFPAGVAGFTLGLFTLMVSLSASAMSRAAPLITALAAIVAQSVLMNQAGISAGPAVAAALVLAFTAVVNLSIISKVRGMVLSLTQSEVKRHLETERFEALDAAKQLIEDMLAHSKKQNAQLLELQADKEVLGALLVHDLRAPLGAVRANLDYAKSEWPGEGDPDVAEALTEASQTTDRLAAMIGDLLNITKLESKAFPFDATQVAPGALLGQLQRQLGAQAKSRSVSVLLEVTETPSVRADAGLLTRALENLASNALRYTPTRGRVQLDVRLDADDVVFAVRNDGPAIPLEARGRLFDKFVQGGTDSENRRAGWGLGLYFCRLVADAHGGSIALEEREGWSTSFVVRLPVIGPALSPPT